LTSFILLKLLSTVAVANGRTEMILAKVARLGKAGEREREMKHGCRPLPPLPPPSSLLSSFSFL
jgi:hypothetical protein